MPYPEKEKELAEKGYEQVHEQNCMKLEGKKEISTCRVHAFFVNLESRNSRFSISHIVDCKIMICRKMNETIVQILLSHSLVGKI